MRRSPLAALGAVAIVLILASCASAPSARPSPTPPTVDATPTATPAPEPRLIEAGTLPPAVFGGDCAVAVPADELTAATGVAGIEVTRRDATWTRSIDNVGGLVCEWQGENVSGNVTILPKGALDGAQLAADVADQYFGRCDWECGWRVESEELWVTGYSSDLSERGRAEADRIGAEIAAGIAARSAAAGLDWRLDRAAWWPVRSCEELASQLATRLGMPVTTQEAGYHDPPNPATLLADIASRRVWCAFEAGGRQIALAVFESGPAWDVPWAELGRPVDLGVSGAKTFISSQGGYLGGQAYEATDGVNVMTVEIAPDSGWAPDELAAAFVATFVAP